jgi:hypothetical protein
MLNLFNAWKQLSGGQWAFVESTTTGGGAHPPGANTNNIASRVGWDQNSISTTPVQDRINHYYLSLPAGAGGNFTLTATLTWLRQSGQTGVNDLNLFLYNAASNLVAASTSVVDNVEHLFTPTLPPGRYDLQVLKRGSIGQVSSSETYALAFEFFNMLLGVSRSGGSAILSWPLAPAGFRLEMTTNLTPSSTWATVTVTPSISNNLNVVSLPAAGQPQFFRLQRP